VIANGGRWIEEPFGAVCADCGAENDLAYRWEGEGERIENPARFIEAICPTCRALRYEKERAVTLDPLRLGPPSTGREIH
jgi:hypothetical protein